MYIIFTQVPDLSPGNFPSEWMTEGLDRSALQHFVPLYPPTVEKLARGLRLMD